MGTRASVEAFAPATVANVACGFDVLGLALEAPGDTVVASRTDAAGARLARITGDGGRLPTAAGANTATIAARTLLARHAPAAGVSLDLHKGLPLASGLGGSAASAVAAVFAVDGLLETGLSRRDLLACALEGERVAAGAAHADNAAACLYGGLVLARLTTPPDVVRLPVPEDLCVALVRPHMEISTAGARMRLGDTVPLRAAVAQWGDLGGFVHALHVGDWDLMGRCLRDHVAEPHRAGRVPGFGEVRQAALEAGALACSLSGSGPSIFALCRGRGAAEKVSRAMETALAGAAGLDCDRHVSSVSSRGARLAGDRHRNGSGPG